MSACRNTRVVISWGGYRTTLFVTLLRSEAACTCATIRHFAIRVSLRSVDSAHAHTDMAERVAAALEATRQRVVEVYAQQKEECTDTAVRAVVFADADPFHPSWLPAEAGADWSLPVTYRDTTRFRDDAFVTEKLLGAHLDFHQSLNIHSALLLKFVLVRRLDVDSAATRFLCFRRLVIEHDLKFTFANHEVQHGLSSNAFHFVPVIEPISHRPCVALYLRRMNYERYSVKALKRAWFFGVMSAICWTPTTQTDGMLLTNSLKDVGLANLNGEFRNFISTAINHALPVRVGAAYLANEPFLFGSVLWPLFKNLLSKKIRSRVKVVGKNYQGVLADLPPQCVPIEMGGERPNDEAELQRILRAYGSMGDVEVIAPALVTSAASASASDVAATA
jgi:hypothetical protein